MAEIGEGILKFIWKCKGPRRAKTTRRMKLKNSHFAVSKVTTKLQLSRQRGAGVRIDIWIRGAELRVQK